MVWRLGYLTILNVLWVMGLLRCFGRIGGGVNRLCDNFRRLFELSENKLMVVADMFILGWGEAWKWWRRLFAWEEKMVGDIKLLLSNVVLQESSNDRWV